MGSSDRLNTTNDSRRRPMPKALLTPMALTKGVSSRVESMKLLRKMMLETSQSPSSSFQDSLDLTKPTTSSKDAIEMIQQSLKILDLDMLDTDSSAPLWDHLSSSSSTLQTSSSSSSTITSARSVTERKKHDKSKKHRNTEDESKTSSSSSKDKKERNGTITSLKRPSSCSCLESPSSSNKIKHSSSLSSLRTKESRESRSSSSKKGKKGARLCARFRLANNEYIPAPPEPLTETEIYMAWYTREEAAQMNSKASKYVDDFEDKHPNSMQDMIRLVAKCYEPSQRQSPIADKRKSKSDSSKKSSMLDEQCKIEAELMYTCCSYAASSISIPSRARGLEYDIITPLCQSRRRHAKAVLDAFGDSPEETREILLNATGEDLDEVVAQRSMVLSRPHRILARALAELDANAVALDE